MGALSSRLYGWKVLVGRASAPVIAPLRRRKAYAVIGHPPNRHMMRKVNGCALAWAIFTAWLVLALALSTALGAEPRKDGCKRAETLFAEQCDPGCVKNGAVTTLEGGEVVLKLTPDKWRGSTYRLYCGGRARVDFSAYSTLEFRFRSARADAGNPLFSVRTWNQRSRDISIRNFIEGGVIDEAFRVARIPISALRTDEWDLGNVESLEWGAEPAGKEYFVDDIVLRQTEGPILETQGTHAPFPESATVLRVTFNKRCRAESVQDPRRYALSSSLDRAYAAPMHPLDVGRRVYVEGFGSSGAPHVRESAFLRFPAPFGNANEYLLRVEGVEDEFCNPMPAVETRFRYDDGLLESPNIKVNQEGYLPDGPKIGYVGGYCGDLGGGLWVVGDNGTIISYDRNMRPLRFSPSPDTTLRSVGGIREDQMYAVGDRGLILQWNGQDWKVAPSGVTDDLHATRFGPTGNGWAVGAKGVCLRHDGARWTVVATPTKVALRGVWTGMRGVAWAVGDHGTVLGFHRGRWVTEDSGTSSDLFAITGVGAGSRVWAVGANGTVLERLHGKWRVYESRPTTSQTLRCVSVGEDGAVWVGGDAGLLWRKAAVGEDGFVTVKTELKEDINGLLTQNFRNAWAVGSRGSLWPFASNGVLVKPPLPAIQARAAFALPYGALRLPIPPPLATIRETSTEHAVLEVPLKLEAANWDLSGEDVYSFNFSELKAPGTYRVHVRGLGVSAAFRVGKDALNKAAFTTSRALYYQRCGEALAPPWAEERFSRPVCHARDPKGRRIDATFHPSVTFSTLHAGEVPGSFTDVAGGRHDAGDYGKYTPTLVAALWHLFTAYDLDPTKFPDRSLNIPESGNRIPDLLDETRHDVDLLTRMQGEDGGVHHKLTTEKWFEGMPQDDPGSRYLFAKTTHDTACSAAIFACAARLWAPYDKAAADLYLERARKAWALLNRRPDPEPKGGFCNPPGNTTGEYRDEEDEDNRLWAAAELYRTTGEAEFGRYFESWWRGRGDRPLGWIVWRHFYRNAYWAYLRSTHPDVDKKIQGEIRARLLREADELVRRTHENHYKNAARLDVREWIGWGAFTQSTQYSFPLLQAYLLTDEPRYREAALLNLDAQLGANPLSICFITGLGARSPRHPLHHPSIHDKVEAPIPGLPVFGPAAHIRNDNRYNAAAQSDVNCYPPCAGVFDPLPILRRYVDAHELVPMSEFTIVDIAATAAAFGLVAEMPVGHQERPAGAPIAP